MSKIINLTQHTATEDQNCFEPIDKTTVQHLLTFATIPSQDEMTIRAIKLATMSVMSGATQAMIGGAPFFMSTLERVLKHAGIQPLYAFSERVSIETVNDDGTVTKTNVFKHMGFVTV